jgi:hypothetical protein
MHMLPVAAILVLCLAAASLGCQAEVRPPPAAAPVAPPEAPARLGAVRLRGDPPGDSVQRAAVAELGDALGDAGFRVVTGDEPHDADLLLTVTSAAAKDGGPKKRWILTLSATVGDHEMEDISGHFVRADGGVDALTVHDMCRRWKRRYQRLQTAGPVGDR